MPNIKHAFSSSVADGGDTSLVQPSNWNAEHSLETYLDFPAQTTTPSAPTATGTARLYAGELATHPLMYVTGYSEPDGYPIGPAIWYSNNGWWSGSGGASLNSLNMPNATVGTISNPAASIGNLQAMARRVQITSSSLAASQASVRNNQVVCHTGGAHASTGSPGGYFLAGTVGTPLVVASSTVGFFGLRPATGAPTVTTAPSTLLNSVGFGFHPADSTWSFWSASAGSPGASTALTGFDVSASAWHRFFIHNPPGVGGSVIYWQAMNVHTGAVSSGSVAGTIPVNASLLAVHYYIQSTGAGSKAISFSSIFLETEY